jgi:hypothetical protein
MFVKFGDASDFGASFGICCCVSDSLVQHLQLVHDGHLSCGPGQHDSHAHSEEGLCSL